MKRTIAELKDFNSAGQNDILQSAVGKVESEDPTDSPKVRQSTRKRKPVIHLGPSDIKKADNKKADKGADGKKGGNVELKKGVKVEARFGGGKLWYTGTIKKVRADDKYDIDYDDGDTEVKISGDMIRTCTVDDGAPLKKGARIEALFGGGKSWYAGTLTAVHANKTYDVEYEDGDKELKVRRDMIRKVREVADKKMESSCKPVVEPVSSDDESDEEQTEEREYWARWGHEFGDGSEDRSLEGSSWRKLGGLLRYKRKHADEFPKAPGAKNKIWVFDTSLEIAKHKISGLAELRKKVRTLLSKAMDSVLELGSYMKGKAYETEAMYDIVAAHIECEMYKTILEEADTMDVSASHATKQRVKALVKDYRLKCRTLVSNLSDPKNPNLRQRVLGKELDVRALCAMSPLDLASTSLQKLRQEVIKKKLVTEVLLATRASSKKLVKSISEKMGGGKSSRGGVGPTGGDRGRCSYLVITWVCVILSPTCFCSAVEGGERAASGGGGSDEGAEERIEERSKDTAKEAERYWRYGGRGGGGRCCRGGGGRRSEGYELC
jgi:hypothetical protein